MKKFNYRSSTQHKKSLKYGGYAAVTTIILLTALVLGNVLFNLLGWKVDLTVEELYTPGDQTIEILDSLEDDVKIYGLYNTGTEEAEVNANVIRLVEAYCDLSDHISFETVDPLTDPAFVSQYLVDSELANGSLIVENQTTGKFKTIPVGYLYEVKTDYDLLLQTITGFSAEEQLTTSIQYVTMEETPVLYQLDGHAEEKLNDEFIEYLGYANYEVATMNLMAEKISEIEVTEYSVVLVNNPKQDLTESEYEILLTYMENGGRMIFLAASDMPDLPNFARLLSRYGLSVHTGTMYERDMNYYWQYCNVLMPKLADDNEITQYMVEDSSNYVLMLAPAAIEISEEKSEGINIEVLVSTTDQAIMKGEGNNLKSVDYEEGDIQGPFNLCVTAEEVVNQEDGTVGTTKLAVIGSSDFIDKDAHQFVVDGNIKLMTLVCDYMQDTGNQLYISAKNMEEATIVTTAADFLFYGALFTIVIPAAIMITGIVVWVRRKHR